MSENLSASPKKDERPIVCGTDFADMAVAASDIAAAIARQLATKLVLVHVDQLHGSLVSDPFVLEAAILQRRRELDREAQRLREPLSRPAASAR